MRTIDGDWSAVGGPDGLRLRTPVHVHGKNLSTVAEFTVGENDTIPFQLTWHPSNEECKAASDPVAMVQGAEQWWLSWCDSGEYVEGRWRGTARASAVVLKGLTYAPTGAVVAAASTSLPERLGGVRNWDYRYGWLRDATFSLLALLSGLRGGGAGMARLVAPGGGGFAESTADHVRHRRRTPPARARARLAARLRELETGSDR